jgi:16S rRNA G966 N2-methylase RsmD
MRTGVKGLPEIIRAPRTDAIYACHSYLTKVPVSAIRPFIEAFTKPGEIVADFFAGSGMTGLAALSVNRRARLSDISGLGKHIASGYVTNISPARMREASDTVLARARQAMGTLYVTKRQADGAKVEMVRTVWSFTYQCPSCCFELVYFRYSVGKGRPPKSCPRCGNEFSRRVWRRLKDVPVEVVVRNAAGRLEKQEPSNYDLAKIRESRKDPRQSKIPSLPIERDREMYSRSGLGKTGMTETRKFFSPRNGVALVELWRAIGQLRDGGLRRKMRFAFTAILPRASMRYQWGAQRPMNAQNQTYYVAPAYYEWNVFELFQRKVEAAIRAADQLFATPSTVEHEQVSDVTYEITSAEHLRHLEDESVDYVFTDPPFGSNIFYSDINLFQEAWLGETTDCTAEAIIHTTGGRKNGAGKRYEALLRKAFEEAWRVLKPGGHMSVVFGNSRGGVWSSVQRALRDAGFRAAPVHVAILDKGQRSMKGLNSGSEDVVTVDLILTMKKSIRNRCARAAPKLANGDHKSLVEEAIRKMSVTPARNASHLYARVVAKAIGSQWMLDDVHLSDVLSALRRAGYSVDRKTGMLQ